MAEQQVVTERLLQMLLDERQRRDELEEMREWMERSQARENERQRRTSKMTKLKLTKLAELEDIESYLTTSLSSEDAADYPMLKEAILRRYDINEETHCWLSSFWDKLIPYVLFAYREVPQESTGFSPFELLYGREVRGPLESWWERR